MLISLNTVMYIIYISGVLKEDGSINNEESIARLAEISLNYAKEGMILHCKLCLVLKS